MARRQVAEHALVVRHLRLGSVAHPSPAPGNCESWWHNQTTGVCKLPHTGHSHTGLEICSTTTASGQRDGPTPLTVTVSQQVPPGEFLIAIKLRLQHDPRRWRCWRVGIGDPFALEHNRARS